LAYWDTLGGFCYRGRNLDKAEKYVSAACNSGSTGEVGDHLDRSMRSAEKDRAIATYAWR